MILVINTSSAGIELALDQLPPCGGVGGSVTCAGGGYKQTKYAFTDPKHQNTSGNIRNLAQNMRKNMTPSEKKFWYAVNNKQLGFKFNKQYPIDNKYIADFVCLEKKLIVEIDGSQHIENKKDAIRTEYLQKFGFNVIRFWNWDINKDLSGCIDVVYDVLTNNSFEKRLAEFEKNLPNMHIDEKGNVIIPPTDAQTGASTPPQGGSWPKAKKIDTDRQSLNLPSETEKFLNENGVKFGDLTAIGVVVGPGSFTGIRLGIAYAKGIAMGLNIPIVPVNAFEIYLERDPDAFVAIDSGRPDLFVGAGDMEPGTMEIEQIETYQMKYPKTVGHKPFDLRDAIPIVMQKLNHKSEISNQQSVIPMYLRPSYAELNCKK